MDIPYFASPFGLQRGSRKMDAIHRRGLSESLQQFAQRLGGPNAKIEAFRPSWALQGLRFLGVVPMDETWETTVGRIGPGARIAPGVAVPAEYRKSDDV
jgi:hypothetical protein